MFKKPIEITFTAGLPLDMKEEDIVERLEKALEEYGITKLNAPIVVQDSHKSFPQINFYESDGELSIQEYEPKKPVFSVRVGCHYRLNSSFGYADMPNDRVVVNRIVTSRASEVLPELKGTIEDIVDSIVLEDKDLEREIKSELMGGYWVEFTTREPNAETYWIDMKTFLEHMSMC